MTDYDHYQTPWARGILGALQGHTDATSVLSGRGRAVPYRHPRHIFAGVVSAADAAAKGGRGLTQAKLDRRRRKTKASRRADLARRNR